MPNCTNLSDNVPLYHCTISKIDLASQSSIILSYILYYNIIYKININTPPFPNDRTNQNTKWYIGTLCRGLLLDYNELYFGKSLWLIKYR